MHLQRANAAKPGTSRPTASLPTQDFKEYVVRVQKNADKMYSVMKFNSGDNVDFTKWKKGTMVREDNLSAFKDQASMPKFGEGSEYGRERREEARKKKFGIISKKYKEEDQPWILKQQEKGGKKYKGRKEGGINDNASHYIFTQMADGSFCASPVKSWYKYTPMLQYKYLNDEEAEEEFGRRDKTLNFFSVMVKRRLKKDASLEGEQKDDKSKAPRKKDSLQIIEDDEYLGFLSDDDFDDDSDDSREAKEKKAKKKVKNSKKRNRVKKKEWGEEAGEESDVDDYDDQEKDYLSEKSSDEEETVEHRKDEERGLDEEIEEINLSSEEEVEEVKEPEPEETENKEKEEKTKEADGSSASGSDSDDSDIDDSKIHSAVFMQNKAQNQVKKTSGKSSKSSSRNSSRPGTPFTGDNNTAATLSGVAGRLQEKGSSNKRQGDAGSSSSSKSQTPGPPAKKSRTESPTPFRGQPGEVRITEDVVRRYLMRKPMTTKDLLHKLNPKRTGMSPSDIGARLTEVMFKLNPKKEVIKDKVYWSIKAT